MGLLLYQGANQQGRRRFGFPGGSAPPPPPPPPGGNQIAASLTRLRGSTGPVLVSGGFPLQPGQVFPAEVTNMRVMVANVEQAVYIEALEGRHSDGSVVSLLIQFIYDVTAGSPLVGELRLGENRTTVDIAKTPISSIPGLAPFPPAPNSRRDNLQDQGYADAVFFPSDPLHLLATNIFEPSITVTAANALGGSFAGVEAAWLTYSDLYWRIWDNFVDPMVDGSGDFVGSILFAAAYYERGKTCGGYLFRSANMLYYRMACSYAFAPIQLYYVANGWIVNEHLESPDTVLMHYWLTGDPTSRNGIRTLAQNNYDIWLPAGLGSKNGPDPRICARTLDACINAYRLGWTDFDWAARAAQIVDRVLGVGISLPLLRNSGSINGAWAPALCGGDDPNTVPVESPVPDVVFNFMNGMMCRSLRSYHRYVFADSRIQAAIKGYLDYGQANELVADNPGTQSTAYYYLSVLCPTEGSNVPAVDLNSFFVSNLAWLAKQLGILGSGAPYLATANLFYDTIRRTPHDGVNGPLHNDIVSNAYNKQFNEAYHDVWPYLYYRLG